MDDLKSIVLLCCPFCNSSAKMSITEFGDSSREYYRVECAIGHAIDCWDDSPSDAAKTWNTRATQHNIQS
jgi:hypothetical protein